MKTARQVLGARAEHGARAFFLARGFLLREQNWRCCFGEIDLLMEKVGRLHIIEVKARASSLQDPHEAISDAKRARLERTFEMWCTKHECDAAKTDHQYDAFLWTRTREGKWESSWVEGI